MAFVTSRAVPGLGQQLAGIYRTEEAADAAVTAGSGLTKNEVLAANIPADADTDGRWWVYDNTADPPQKAVHSTPPPVYSARAQAAVALLDGLAAFREFVLAHAGGVNKDPADIVLEFLRQKRRTCRMLYENTATLNGVPLALSDAQFIAWATYSRFGPLDTSAITALGVYNPEGLFAIFERSGDPAVIDPTGPITWVGIDTSQWTADGDGNANAVPNRLNVAQIAPVTGTAPSEYENVDDRAWLEIT